MRAASILHGIPILESTIGAAAADKSKQHMHIRRRLNDDKLHRRGSTPIAILERKI